VYRDVTTGRPERDDDNQATNQWVDHCRALVEERLGLVGSRVFAPPEARIYTAPASATGWASGNRQVQCQIGYRLDAARDGLRQTMGSAVGRRDQLPEAVLP
jgi:hypothetical protein